MLIIVNKSTAIILTAVESKSDLVSVSNELFKKQITFNVYKVNTIYTADELNTGNYMYKNNQITKIPASEVIYTDTVSDIDIESSELQKEITEYDNKMQNRYKTK